MTLLDVEVWSGKIAAGSWRPGEGPPLRVREAASGEEIGRLGTASVEQAVEAARRAATDGASGSETEVIRRECRERRACTP